MIKSQAEELAMAIRTAAGLAATDVVNVRRTRRGYVADLRSRARDGGVVASILLRRDGFGGFSACGFSWNPRSRTLDASCRTYQQAELAMKVARSLARAAAPVRVMLRDGRTRITTGGRTVAMD